MAPLIPNLGTRRRWVVNCSSQLLPPGKKPAPVKNEAGWTPEPLWTVLKVRSSLRVLRFLFLRAV